MSTPMRRQYLELKRAHPEAILLFRLGDFYEAFDEDARVVAEVCGIVLTSRPVSKGERVPMAGVPYHAAESYIAKLLRAGYKVAIAEQVEPASAGLMDRRVTRVITPGTIAEESLLDPSRPNHLLALTCSAERGALAYADISTGRFAAEEQPAEFSVLVAALARLRPAEVLVLDSDPTSKRAAEGAAVPVTLLEGWRFSPERAQELLLRHFGVASLSSFGLDGRPEAAVAAAMIVHYVERTCPAALSTLDSLRVEEERRFLYLDEAAQRALDLLPHPSGLSLLDILDCTQTPMGARLLRERLLRPLTVAELVEERLDAVEALHQQDTLRSQLLDALRGMTDLERLAARLRQRTIAPRQLVALAAALRRVQRIAEILCARSEVCVGELRELRALDPCLAVAELIDSALVEEPPADARQAGIFRRGYSQQLDELLDLVEGGHQLLAELERQERERTGIRSLRLGHNSVFGYYIEVPRSQAERVPADYIARQTLANAERYQYKPLKELEAHIYGAQERRVALEQELWQQLLSQLEPWLPRLQRLAGELAVLDVDCALAEVAKRQRYCRPTIESSSIIEIKRGRHPVVEVSLARQGRSFVPNDTRMNCEEEQILVITGPNMAGKSTYLRQVALIVIMAQMGSFVPADEARIGIVDRIFTRIGARDELSSGQSTFMVEMIETATILRQATPRSLVVLDEIGRGTSTFDGMAIARAVVEHLHNSPALGCRALFATHYHELADLEQYLPRARNYTVAVAENEQGIFFLYQIVRGSSDRSYGVHVAQLAGIPAVVVARAREILAHLEAQQRMPVSAPSQPVLARQLGLFSPQDPLIQELAQLDVEGMTPLAALNRLDELARRARQVLGAARSRQNLKR
jgi:DNA mismatch repair protein MutS